MKKEIYHKRITNYQGFPAYCSPDLHQSKIKTSIAWKYVNCKECLVFKKYKDELRRKEN